MNKKFSRKMYWLLTFLISRIWYHKVKLLPHERLRESRAAFSHLPHSHWVAQWVNDITVYCCKDIFLTFIT